MISLLRIAYDTFSNWNTVPSKQQDKYASVIIASSTTQLTPRKVSGKIAVIGKHVVTVFCMIDGRLEKDVYLDSVILMGKEQYTVGDSVYCDVVREGLHTAWKVLSMQKIEEEWEVSALACLDSDRTEICNEGVSTKYVAKSYDEDDYDRILNTVRGDASSSAGVDSEAKVVTKFQQYTDASLNDSITVGHSVNKIDGLNCENIIFESEDISNKAFCSKIISRKANTIDSVGNLDFSQRENINSNNGAIQDCSNEVVSPADCISINRHSSSFREITKMENSRYICKNEEYIVDTRCGHNMNENENTVVVRVKERLGDFLLLEGGYCLQQHSLTNWTIDVGK